MRVPAYLPVSTKLQTKKILKFHSTKLIHKLLAVDCDADNSIKILQKVLTAVTGPVKVPNIVRSGLTDIFLYQAVKTLESVGIDLLLDPDLSGHLRKLSGSSALASFFSQSRRATQDFVSLGCKKQRSKTNQNKKMFF